MAFSRYLSQALLDHLMGMGTRNYTSPTHVYIALSTTAPNADGSNVTEPSGNGYARVQSSDSDWSSTTLATPAVCQNINPLAFAAASANWNSGNPIGWFAVYDAISGGNLLFFGELAQAVTVLAGNAPTFLAGALVVTEQ